MTTASAIPFLDLKAQQARIAADLRRRLDARAGALPVHPRARGRGAGSRSWRDFCGARHCVGVSSGTDAIQIALMAEGIGRGDAVFLPAFTYTATAEVPLVLGATPVFVDVDPRTFQIDPAHLAHRIADVRARRKAAAARADRRGSVRPARRLAGAARNRRARRTCSRWTTWRRASAATLHGRRWAPRPTRPRPASSRPSRSAPTATAARCSPRATNAPRCIAACARTARAPRATRCCAPA